MEQNYSFSRDDNIEPTGAQVATNISTSIRGNDPSFEAIMSGIESFSIACGFELNGSGIGRIPPVE